MSLRSQWDQLLETVTCVRKTSQTDTQVVWLKYSTEIIHYNNYVIVNK